MQQNIFLDNLKFPSMNSEDKRQMDEPLTSEEVLNAILKMKSGKQPALMGYQ